MVGGPGSKTIIGADGGSPKAARVGGPVVWLSPPKYMAQRVDPREDNVLKETTTGWIGS